MMVAFLLALFSFSSLEDIRDRRGAPPPPPADDQLRVEVVQSARMTSVEIEAVRDQVTRIWRSAGIEVVFLGPDVERRGTALRLMLTDAVVGASGPALCAMGAIRFVGGRPEAEFSVSVSTIREFVRRARAGQSPGVQMLDAARIAGRVAAHEMGHYLLGDKQHQARGLMRARFDGAELLAPRLDPFTPPPRHQLAAGFARLAGESGW